MFDSDWYLRRYPDVWAERVNPLVHYLEDGAPEGRDPSPLFDTDWYVAQYPDTRTFGHNPLHHYLHYGAAEGRTPGQSGTESGAEEVRARTRGKAG
jgi:hypothetical protein